MCTLHVNVHVRQQDLPLWWLPRCWGDLQQRLSPRSGWWLQGHPKQTVQHPCVANTRVWQRNWCPQSLSPRTHEGLGNPQWLRLNTQVSKWSKRHWMTMYFPHTRCIACSSVAWYQAFQTTQHSTLLGNTCVYQWAQTVDHLQAHCWLQRHRWQAKNGIEMFARVHCAELLILTISHGMHNAAKG